MLRTRPSDKQNVVNAQRSTAEPRVLQVLCQKPVFCDSVITECMLRSNFTGPGEIVVLACLRRRGGIYFLGLNFI